MIKLSKIITSLGSIANSALEMIYPACCEVCGEPLIEGEHLLCVKCLLTIPRTRCHSSEFNELHQRLASPTLPIERAAAYFHYRRDEPFSGLIRSAKYNSRPGIARYLGGMYAREIQGDGFFEGIDLLVPVPLHRLKHAQRGYNQSHAICQGISDVTSIPVATSLITVRRHSAQARKSKAERRENVKDIFSATAEPTMAGKHVLIVDDIITTGATLYNAAETFHSQNPDTTISVLTLGITMHD